MAKWLDSGDLLPYDDQVGGHKFTKEKPLLGLYNDIKKCILILFKYIFFVCYVGLLKHKEGYILKSVEGGTKGKNEVRFYEELKNNETLTNLRELVPSYFGTVTIKINSKGNINIIIVLTLRKFVFKIYLNPVVD